jgi:hypothetical protein
VRVAVRGGVRVCDCDAEPVAAESVVLTERVGVRVRGGVTVPEDVGVSDDDVDSVGVFGGVKLAECVADCEIDLDTVGVRGGVTVPESDGVMVALSV